MTVYAAIQMQPILLDINANIKKIDGLMEKAAEKKVELAVFPECCLTGYDMSLEKAKEIAIRIPGPQTETLSSLCQKHQMHIVVGSIESSYDGKYYNAAILIGPQGFIGKYRKTHMPFLAIDRFLDSGNNFPVIFDTKIGKIGLMICYDVFFPEAARLHGIAGAQIITIPTAWLSGNNQFPEFVRSRAAENDVFVIGSNWVGEEKGATYLGCSSIVGPSGEILAKGSASDEEIVYAEFDPSKTHRGRIVFEAGKFEMDLWNERRPDLYGPIAIDNRSK